MTECDDRQMPADPKAPKMTFAEGEWMDLRLYAAIHLKLPESGIAELDAMIRKANRDELAARAMAGICSTLDRSELEPAQMAVAVAGIPHVCFWLADRMLAESSKGAEVRPPSHGEPGHRCQDGCPVD